MIKLVQSEVIKNYAGAIAIFLGALPGLGSLVVSVVTVLRGEPYAEKTWVTLRKQVDEQTSAINAINLKFVKMEALQEGLQLGKLQGALEVLQKQYDRLRREKIKKVEASTSKKSSVTPPPAPAKEESQHLEDTKKLIKDYLRQQSSKTPLTPKTLKTLPKEP